MAGPFTLIKGTRPLILAQPHSGTFVPEEMWPNLSPAGRGLKDTDWYIPKLYEGLIDDISIVRANFSRYVIDANRDPKGKSLYPGQNTTSLVPRQTFGEEPLWREPLSDFDIQNRIERFHRPYHRALSAEISRIKSLHGYAILYDCHSIRSEVPYLFEARLPDLNIGDNGGKTCAPILTKKVSAISQKSDFTHVVNDRFKGGWTTRHYGSPSNHIHAIQMEIAQSCYLKEEVPPFRYDEEKAEKLRGVLAKILRALCETSPQDLMTET